MNTPNTDFSAVYNSPIPCPQCGQTQPGLSTLPQISGALPQNLPMGIPGQTQPGLSTLPQFSGALPQNPAVNPLLNYDTSGMGGASGVSGMQGTESPQQIISSQNFPIVSTNPMSLNAESLQYMNGFLRTQIGRRVRVEFLLGSNTLTERTGILVAVGTNYIIINEMGTRDLLACDYYNIKFVRFYY